MLIGGTWTPAATGKTMEVFNPATGDVLGQVAAGDREDVNRAVKEARNAFDRGVWESVGAEGRGRILWRIADLIESNIDELSELECLNNGMPFRDAKFFFIAQAARCFRYFAGCTDKIQGRSSQITAGSASYHAYTMLEPVGVAALIVPWNAPLMSAAWKLAPALAAGCTCVLKPSKETPLTALRLGELLLEAGVPAGVVNIVPGPGETVGTALAEHSEVDKVSFTGSTESGRKILHAAAGNMKKLSLELGGKSPTIVFDDADLEQAIAGVAQAIFANSGQICIAGSRLYVQKKSYERVVAGVAAHAEKLRLGDGMSPETEMGPLISSHQQAHVLDLVESGLAEGAELITGGKRFGNRGYFVTPTVLGRTKAAMRAVREEIFGPVLCAASFDDPEEAICAANASRYGLAASIWTRDISRSHSMARKLRAGVLGINSHGVFDYSLPNGGYKESGWGREHGQEGLLEYMEVKSVFALL
jgi:phenylacetaldehyde dehydrogenase